MRRDGNFMRGKRSEVSPPSSISPGIIWRRRPPGALTSPSFTCARAAPSLHLQYCFLFTLLGVSSHVTSCSLSQAPRQNSPSVTQHWVDSASKAMLRHHIMFHKHVFPSRFLSSGRASAVFVSSAQHNPWRKGRTRLDELNWILECEDWEEPKRPSLLSNVHMRLKWEWVTCPRQRQGRWRDWSWSFLSQ